MDAKPFPIDPLPDGLADMPLLDENGEEGLSLNQIKDIIQELSGTPDIFKGEQ